MASLDPKTYDQTRQFLGEHGGGTGKKQRWATVLAGEHLTP